MNELENKKREIARHIFKIEDVCREKDLTDTEMEFYGNKLKYLRKELASLGASEADYANDREYLVRGRWAV